MVIPLTLIKLYLRESKHEEINSVYDKLPESVRKNEAFISLKTHSHFMQIASNIKEPGLLQK